MPAFFCLSLLTAAQTKSRSDYAIVKTAGGIAVNYTNAAPPFGLTIAGKSLSAEPDAEGAIAIRGGGGFSISFFKTEDFIDSSVKVTGREILSAPREWRSWMQAAATNGRVAVVEGDAESLTVSGAPGAAAKQTRVVPALSWYSGREAETARVFYRTALIGNVVVMVGAAFDGKDEIEKARTATREMLASLTLLPAPKVNNGGAQRKIVKRKN